MKLQELIKDVLLHQEVIGKIAEAIRNELINNQRLTEKEIADLDSNLEVIDLENDSRTLLGDYPNLESAIEESIEKNILPSLENKNSHTR